MGTTTTNLGLYKPDIGETGWGSSVDDNFDTLDALHSSSPLRTRYVTRAGSNTNDGLSWGTAMADIITAYDDIPDDGGAGVIYFEDNVYVDSANTDRGLWLAGPNDSHFASLLPGWRTLKNISVVGRGGLRNGRGVAHKSSNIMRGGSATDRNKPLIWLSGGHDNCYFANIQSDGELARPVILGLDSANNGTTTTAGNFIMDNVSLSTATGSSSYGPCVDIYSGYWMWFRDVDLGCNSAAAHDADERAAIFVHGALDGEALFFVQDSTFFNGGGFKYSPLTGAGPCTLSNVTQEGVASQLIPSAPIFWYTDDNTPTNVPGAVLLMQLEGADSPVTSDPAVLIAPTVPAGKVIVIGIGNVGSTATQGPCTILASGNSVHGDSLAGQGQTGFWGNRVAAQHEGHKRAFHPTLARYANLVSQDTSTWGSAIGSATVTTGQAAPDGTTNAAKFTSGGGTLYRQIYRASATVAVGDWLIGGVWARSDSTTAFALPLEIATAASNNILDTGVSYKDAGFPTSTHGKSEWEFVTAATKVVTVGTASTDFIFTLSCSDTAAMHYFAPVFFRIPAASAPSDSEVKELALHLATWPDTAAVSQVGLLRDQSLHIPKGYVELTAMTAPSAPTGSSTRGRIYMDTSGGKQRLMILFDSGVAQQIAIEP